jgi:glycosyltransferase involved in cell wall biosynthesis
MTRIETQFRVALVAGTLQPGGAEKQLVYMARALLGAGVAVRVYTLTHGSVLEDELRHCGVPTTWIGQRSHPLFRIAALAWALRHFRPHVVQSTHFFGNLYVSAVAPLYGAMAIGGVRTDVHYDLASTGRWGPWLLRVPPSVIANSEAGKRNAERLGVAPGAVYVVPNVIDVARFDRLKGVRGVASEPGRLVVAAVGRHLPEKRLDRFLRALALARQEVPGVCGIVVGDGPERSNLESLAEDLGLLPGVRFLGYRSDVARLLHGEADVLMLTSDQEGFPNVLLEAMAAGLPVITTPAGDAAIVVQDQVTGYVVPFDEVAQLAERLVGLARSPQRRRDFGAAARLRAAHEYGSERLAGHLLAAYGAFARHRAHRRVLAALATC